MPRSPLISFDGRFGICVPTPLHRFLEGYDLVRGGGDAGRSESVKNEVGTVGVLLRFVEMVA